MITYAQAIILGLLQGVTELFPISSLGHSVLVPGILHWNIDQASPEFVSFVVATHFATALVLLGFFWRDWYNIVSGILKSLVTRKINSVHARIGWLLIVGTIPAGLRGLVFQKKFEALFGASTIVAGALILNGVLLLIAERLRRRAREGAAEDFALARLTWTQTLVIGTSQCLALIPGFSRTGAAMTGGLWSGLSHENAARFSFLLATPIIFAAATLKLPKLFASGGESLSIAFVGALGAAVAAYASVKFLSRYFKTKTLTPFAIYCILAGVLSLAILLS